MLDLLLIKQILTACIYGGQQRCQFLKLCIGAGIRPWREMNASQLYPSISLRGVAGWTNNLGGTVMDPAGMILNAAASLFQPIFNAGAMRGKVKIARADQKALKKFHSYPLGTLTEKQRSIYLDLPSVFTTREGLSIALQHSMSERTFKDWIKTAIFKKLDYGTYEKRYK